MSFRSKPIFDVTAQLEFEPKVISIENIDCHSSRNQIFEMGRLKVCFTLVETTKSKAGRGLNQNSNSSIVVIRSSITTFTLAGLSGPLKSGLNISCLLNVDPLRQTARGFFSKADSKARNHTATHQLLNQDNCFTYPIYMTV